MKIRLNDGATSTYGTMPKNLDAGVITPLAVRDATGTHLSRSSTGFNDAEVARLVSEHQAAVKAHQEGWDAICAAEKARGWMGRLFPARTTPPPAPEPLPSYIVARARELGLI